MNGDCALLGLPPELQDMIYKEVLLAPSHNTPQLLRVCREMYSKARKFLFQRALYFRSQLALQQWIQRVPRDHLHYVSEIAIELQDVDLTPLLALSTTPVAPVNLASPLRTRDVYLTDLTNLRRSFEKLPNVKKFTLRAMPGPQSHLYRDYLNMALNTLGAIYPGIQELALGGNMHHQSLGFLRIFRELHTFSFDGFTASGASETADILSGLRLKHVSLVSQQALLTPTYDRQSGFTSDLQSFDSSVLRKLDQLESFSVTERYSTTSSALFFTAEILGSLYNHNTLSSLSILLSYAPDARTLEALELFLERSSSTQNLELDWLTLNPNVLEQYALLPDSLQSFWIRACGLADAFDIVCHILGSREAGDASRLREVVLRRKTWHKTAMGGTNWGSASAAVQNDQDSRLDPGSGQRRVHAAGDDSGEHTFAQARTGLNALGIQVAWCTDGSARSDHFTVSEEG